MDLMRFEPRVRRLARQYSWATRGGALELDDLVQAGMMGLHYGATRYDAARCASPWGYLQHWVRHHIQREVDAVATTVRRPRGARMDTAYSVSIEAESPQCRSLADRLPAATDRGAEPVLDSALACLSAKERDTVRRILRGETMPEIARDEGLCRFTLNLRVRKAVRKLQSWAR